MGDEFTSTDMNQLYAIRYQPGGEVVLVRAGNATTARGQAEGLAAAYNIEHRGAYHIDKATDADLDGPYTVNPIETVEDEEGEKTTIWHRLGL
jgi:hypothetical protein